MRKSTEDWICFSVAAFPPFLSLEIFFFFRFYLVIFRETGREGGSKRGRETSKCGCLWSASYWRPDLAHNPSMCPDWESNPRAFGSQAGAQSAESRQPGQILFIFRERRREEEREGEKLNVQGIHLLVASHPPLTGDWACDPGMCPEWESNWHPLGSQAGTRSTEPPSQVSSAGFAPWVQAPFLQVFTPCQEQLCVLAAERCLLVSEGWGWGGMCF